MTTTSAETAEAARNTLFELMIEMNMWEVEYHAKYKRDGPEKHKPEAKKTLHALFAKYFTHRERKEGRELTLNAGSPPEYDPDREELGETTVLSEHKVSIVTHYKHPTRSDVQHSHRYTMVLKSGAWVLDKKERLSVLSNRWDPIPL
jgi:hypothetical protein